VSTHPVPFVKDLPEKAGTRDSRRSFWAPDCAGLDYTAACDLGTELAFGAVQYMRAEDLPALLGWSVMEMPDYRSADGARRGVMVGFLGTIARLAMDAATPERLAAYERRHAEGRAFWRRLGAEEAKRERARERRRARRPAGEAHHG
jgi:hypothetical protein